MTESFQAIKEQMVSYLSEYSSRKTSERDDSVDFEKLQIFMEQKQSEIKELQNFLVAEFQGIERFKDVKQRIVTLLKNQVLRLLIDIKSQFHQITQNYQQIYRKLVMEVSASVHRTLQEKNSHIEILKNKINSLQRQLEQSKAQDRQISKTERPTNYSQQIIRDLEELKLKQKISRKQYEYNKTYSNKNMLKPQSHLYHLSYEQLQRSTSKSKSAAYLYPQHYRKKSREKIEILKNSGISQTQNNKNVLRQLILQPNQRQKACEQKKYVKEKIQFLKNKGSMIRDSKLQKSQEMRRSYMNYDRQYRRL